MATDAPGETPKPKRRGGRPGPRSPGPPCELDPFPALPLRWRNLLVRARIASVAELQAMPDDELVRAKGMTLVSVDFIRTIYPYTGGPITASMICPCCGGEGRVLRFGIAPPTNKRGRTSAKLRETSRETPHSYPL